MKWSIDFEEKLFEITRRPRVKMPVPQLAADPLNLLQPYPLMGFEFCRYWDQALDARREGQKFVAFGSCDLGVFLLDECGCVRLYAVQNGIFHDELVYVSRDFEAFVSSYCLFLAAAFFLASHLDKSAQGAEAASARFESDMQRIHKGDLGENRFWSQILFMLEDGEVPIRPPILQYFDDDRVLQ